MINCMKKTCNNQQFIIRISLITLSVYLQIIEWGLIMAASREGTVSHVLVMRRAQYKYSLTEKRM